MLSTRKPPRKSPIGIVKNCIVLRQAYTRPCISAGIVNADFFQDTRNHYDRFVHFSFGLLMFPYFKHLCKEWFKLSVPIAILVSWLIIQTGSMIYELFEWLLTVVMSSEEADYYNGQQGDMWDAQKDMALAMVGSTISAVLLSLT